MVSFAGLRQIHLKVADLAHQLPFDAALDQLVAAGATVISRSELAPGWPTAFLRDPDGYAFQI